MKTILALLVLLASGCTASSPSGSDASVAAVPEPVATSELDGGRLRAPAPVPMGGDVTNQSNAARVVGYNGSQIIGQDAGGMGCGVPPSNPGQFAVVSANNCYTPTSISGDLAPSVTVPGNVQVCQISGCPNGAHTGYVQFVNDAGTVLAQAGPFAPIPTDYAFYGGNVIPNLGGSNYSLLFTQTGGSVSFNASTNNDLAISGIPEIHVTFGETGFNQAIGGYLALPGLGSTTPLSYYRRSQVLDDGGVTIDAGFVQITLDPSVYVGPHLLFSGTLGNSVVVVFPTVIGACWYVDVAFVVFGGHTIILQANNVNWATTITTNLNEYYVCYGDIGRLYGTVFTP